MSTHHTDVTARGFLPFGAGAATDHTNAGLSDTEPRYRALLRHLPDTVVALYDRNLLGVSIEGRRLREAGFPVERFEGMPLRSAMPAEDCERLEPLYRAALQGEESAMELSPLGKT